MLYSSRRSFLFFLSGEKSNERDALDSNDFKTDTRNISFGLTLFTESSNNDFIVFRKIVEATVPWDKSSYFLSILLEHDSDSFSDSGVGLFGLYTDFLDDESLGHT